MRGADPSEEATLLVSCRRNNIPFAGGQLAVFQGASEAPISGPFALPAAHFDRNKRHAISATGH
jgi:hypothetical protein